MNRTTIKRKALAIALCGALLVPTTAFAGTDTASETVSLSDFENYISTRSGVSTLSATDNVSLEAFNYMESAMPEAELSAVLSDYQASEGSREKTYSMFETNLNATYQEAQVHDFTKEEAASVFKISADLETGNAKLTEFTPVPEDTTLPAPPHSDATDNGASKESISLLSNSDISTGRNGEVTGLGYEVKSLTGYNRISGDMYPGTSNIGDLANYPGDIAGYMFYTVSDTAGRAEDLGLVYCGNGYWQPVVSGTWTGWATGSKKIAAGSNVYLQIWIDENNQLNFLGLDGNNMSTILFQSAYTTWGQLPQNGSGVSFNRQVTYAANEGQQNDHTGLYVKNARFDRAYIYNDITGACSQFNNSNTVSTRRGKFGASWAPYSRVTINSNTHWYSENISINMN